MPPRGLFFSMRASLAKLSPMHLVSAIKRPREEVGGVGNFWERKREAAVPFCLVAGSPEKLKKGWFFLVGGESKKQQERIFKKKGE